MKLGNLQEVEAWKPGGAPPPGNHVCRVDDAKEGTSSGGHPQLELSWTVETGEYQGAEIRDWLVVVEATRGKVVALLEATGVEIPPGEFDLKVDDLIGRHAEVVVRLEPSYKDPDKMISRVAGYRATEARPAAATSANGSAGAGPDIPF